MSLNVEIYSYGRERWISLFKVNPEQPCLIRDRSPSGARHVYVLNCAPDGESSTISTTSTKLGQEDIGEIRKLAKGESCKQIIFTGMSLMPNTFRFSHT